MTEQILLEFISSPTLMLTLKPNRQMHSVSLNYLSFGNVVNLHSLAIDFTADRLIHSTLSSSLIVWGQDVIDSLV